MELEFGRCGTRLKRIDSILNVPIFKLEFFLGTIEKNVRQRLQKLCQVTPCRLKG